MTEVLQEKQHKNGALPVYDVNEGEKLQAADFGSWQNYPITGTENGRQILPFDRFRRRAVIIVNSPPASSNLPTANVPFTATGAANAVTTLTIPLTLFGTKVLTSLSVSFSGASANAVTITATDGTTSLSWVIPTAQAQPVFIQLPAAGLYFNNSSAVTITVSAAGAGITTTINASAQTFFIAGLSQLGYILVGSLRQVQNGQGIKLRSGNSLVIENVQDTYLTGDGTTAFELNILNERFSPYEQRTEQTNSDHD